MNFCAKTAWGPSPQYRLATYLGNGMSFRRLVERLALPAWVYGLQPRAGATGLAKLVSERFLEPLMEFGLLTIQQPLHNRSMDSQETYVPAPLLSRFLGFDIQATANPRAVNQSAP